MGLSTVVMQGGISLGSLVVGSVGAIIGIGAAFSLGGALFATITGTVVARVPALRGAMAADSQARSSANVARATR
jgi:hypothetical protein